MADDDTLACPSCGAENPAENAYCEKCHKLLTDRADDLGLGGFPRPRPTSAPPTSPSRASTAKPVMMNVVDLRCKACGAPMPPVPGATSVTCRYCGASLALAPTPAPTPRPSPLLDGEDEGDDQEGWGRYWFPGGLERGPGPRIASGLVAIVMGIVFYSYTAGMPTCGSTGSSTANCLVSGPLSPDVVLFSLLGLGALLILWGAFTLGDD